MDCDRCGRTIEGGALVSLGARRPFRNLCRTCWGVETRSSNSRLISALNEMTRRVEEGDRSREPARAAKSRRAPTPRDEDAERRRKTVERRDDPERPRWHP